MVLSLLIQWNTESSVLSHHDKALTRLTFEGNIIELTDTCILRAISSLFKLSHWKEILQTKSMCICAYASRLWANSLVSFWLIFKKSWNAPQLIYIILCRPVFMDSHHCGEITVYQRSVTVLRAPQRTEMQEKMSNLEP